MRQSTKHTPLPSNPPTRVVRHHSTPPPNLTEQPPVSSPDAPPPPDLPLPPTFAPARPPTQAIPSTSILPHRTSHRTIAPPLQNTLHPHILTQKSQQQRPTTIWPSGTPHAPLYRPPPTLAVATQPRANRPLPCAPRLHTAPPLRNTHFHHTPTHLSHPPSAESARLIQWHRRYPMHHARSCSRSRCPAASC